MTFIEIEKTISGFTGRLVGSVQSLIACGITGGRIAAVRR